MDIWCDNCCKTIKGDEVWSLKYMGDFCALCALEVLNFWKDQVHLAIRKIKEAEGMVPGPRSHE